MSIESITTSAPGRICLFGEHQDYLDLPIIASAISKRFFFTGTRNSSTEIQVYFKDLGQHETFNLSNLAYRHPRDYLKSSINVLIKSGYEISYGFTAEAWSNIPIKAGVSSSSAMVNAWMLLVLQINGYLVPDAIDLGRMVYEAEVEEFGEPGGRMDQYTIAFGNTIYLENQPEIKAVRLPLIAGGFILANSGQEKDTIPVLAFAKDRRLRLLEKIRTEISDYTWAANDNPSFSFLTKEENDLLNATIRNRSILEEALSIWKVKDFNQNEFGKLLYEHHKILSKYLGVSTPLIDQTIEGCIHLGALGGKIVGSGGGGCFIIYFREEPGHILEYLQTLGMESFVVEQDEGTRVESL